MNLNIGDRIQDINGLFFEIINIEKDIADIKYFVPNGDIKHVFKYCSDTEKRNINDIINNANKYQHHVEIDVLKYIQKEEEYYYSDLEE